MAVPSRRSSAFSVEQIRAAVRGQAMVPAGMLQAALAKTYDKLSAKETKFFAHQGEVVNTREVEADGIQLAAARLILEMGELLTKNVAIKPAAPPTTLEIDPKTGVIKLHIGEVQTHEVEAVAAPSAVAWSAPQTPPATTIDMEPPQEADDTEWHKVPRGKLPQHILDALFKDPVVENENGHTD